MSRNALVALALSLAAGCNGITETRHPTAKNPTEWIYAQPLARVSECLQSNELAADRWGNRVKRSYDQPENARQTQLEFEIALDSEGYGSDAVHSEVYRYHACPLGLYGHWLVRAQELDPDHTRVAVIPKHLEVHNYRCFTIGHPWGCAIPVESSTIEEYRLLTALGRCLAEPKMPPPTAPSGSPPDPASCE